MRMANLVLVLGALAVAAGSLVCLAEKSAEGKKKKILFYSQSFGFRHSVVARPPSGEMAHAEKELKKMAEAAGYDLDVSQDFNDIRGENLKKYDAIVLYTTGNPLIDRDAFMKWLKAGGALIGIHTATDSFHQDTQMEVPMTADEKDKVRIPHWPEYIQVIGGAFKGHGRTHDPVTIKVEDPKHPATEPLEDGWQISDEIYQFNRFSKDKVHVLLSIDTEKMDDKTLKGHNMKREEYYPVSWTNTVDKGRVFYTSLGHREDVWTNAKYQKHLLGGIAWALRPAGEKQ